MLVLSTKNRAIVLKIYTFSSVVSTYRTLDLAKSTEQLEATLHLTSLFICKFRDRLLTSLLSLWLFQLPLGCSASCHTQSRTVFRFFATKIALFFNSL